MFRYFWLLSLLSCFVCNTFAFTHEVNKTVPNGGGPLVINFKPGVEFSSNPFKIGMSYTLSHGDINSIQAALRHGDTSYELISFGDVISGPSFVSPPITIFMNGNKNADWSLIIIDNDKDFDFMKLSCIRMDIPEPSSVVLLSLGFFSLFICSLKGRSH